MPAVTAHEQESLCSNHSIRKATLGDIPYFRYIDQPLQLATLSFAAKSMTALRLRDGFNNHGMALSLLRRYICKGSGYDADTQRRNKVRPSGGNSGDRCDNHRKSRS